MEIQMGCLDGLCVDVKGWIVPSATIRCQMTKAITEKSDRQNSAYSNTSETISAVTKEKQKQETKSDLKLVSSNWLGSNVDIDILQSEERATKAIHHAYFRRLSYNSYFRQRIGYSFETMDFT